MKRLKIKLPELAKTILNESLCPFCKTKLTTKDVVAAGLRKALNVKGTPTVYFCESQCSKCKNPNMLQFTSMKHEEDLADAKG